MTFLCAPITVETAEQALADANAARLAGAQLVEYRVDGFLAENDADDDAAASIGEARRIVADSPLPCIATCRISAEGGAFEGENLIRLRLFRSLIDADRPPRFIDIELATIEGSPEFRALAAGLEGAEAPRLIVSMHDFAQRPADLSRRLSRLLDVKGGAVVKLAHRARSLRDNLELFEILDSRDRPTIALGMGEFGLMSRVLAPKFGAFLTFASLRAEAATAPGQPTLLELLDLYRFKAINAETRVFGVIGWPVSHSFSPVMHNAGFESRAFNGVYLPLPIPPEWEHFKATLGALCDDPRLDFSGASVTIPHKEHLLRFAKERSNENWSVDALADAAGAANTVVRQDRGWRVFNTDAPAIVQCLTARLGDLRDRRIAVLGAGGAARSAAAALVGEGATVMIYNRTHQRAERIADELRAYADTYDGRIVATSLDLLSRTCADVILNTTPVGMRGGPDSKSRPVDLETLTQASDELLVFDTVYNPVETPLLRQARERGLPTIDGVEMFVRQGALQFAAWTGRTAPVELFERVVRERLASSG